MTTENTLADALRGLARGAQGRSMTARLRDVFPQVESALAAGVSRALVLETLNGHGLAMTPKNFEQALYRIRKQQRAAGMSSSAAPEAGAADQQGDSEILSTRARRERFADQFVSGSHPLLKHLQNNGGR